MPIYNEVWDDMGTLKCIRLPIPLKVELEDPSPKPLDETGVSEIRLRGIQG
jgi:hypothetical protein